MSVDQNKTDLNNEISDKELDGVVGGSILSKAKDKFEHAYNDVKNGAENAYNDAKNGAENTYSKVKSEG